MLYAFCFAEGLKTPDPIETQVQFVVQRVKSVPTLSSVAALHRAAEGAPEEEKHRKEQANQDTKSEELGTY